MKLFDGGFKSLIGCQDKVNRQKEQMKRQEINIDDISDRGR